MFSSTDVSESSFTVCVLQSDLHLLFIIAIYSPKTWARKANVSFKTCR